MAYKQKWTKISQLKAGGQGVTYLVTNSPYVLADPTTFTKIFISVNNILLSGKPLSHKKKEQLSQIGARFLSWIASDQRGVSQPLAVEKILHKPKSLKELKKKRGRLEVEIGALKAVSHPNLVNLIDYNIEALSYVLEYYSNGSLSDQITNRGQVLASLCAARPLIEGLAKLHEHGFTHRDIKPDNILVGSDGQLVLGDFGIIFDSNQDGTRITEESEKVGTTGYMPSWNMLELMEDIPPSHDVYAMGKVLYEMISGRRLHFWYLDKPHFFLPDMFPEASSDMRLAHALLKKCVCENEDSCLPDASALLVEVDRTIFILKRNGQYIDHTSNRHCTVCADGIYKPMATNTERIEAEGQETGSISRFACANCGHVQTFFFEGGNAPPAW